jgi:DNA-binding MarR family transcriptional regulator
MSNHNLVRTRTTLAAELVERLRLAQDAADALIQEQLRPYGLSLSQGRLFGLVADLSLRGQAPLQKDLEAGMRLVTSSITNIIQGIERLGLIARITSNRDGRAKELHITAQGWELYRELGQHLPEWHSTLTRFLNDQELADAVRLLQKLTGNAG